MFSLPELKRRYQVIFESLGPEYEKAVAFAGRTLDVSKDGKFIGVACVNGGIVLDALTGAEVMRLEQPVTAVAFPPIAREIAFGQIKPGQVCVLPY